MNYSTNVYINLVSDCTLVIGIDITKHKYYAYVVTDRDKVLLNRVILSKPKLALLLFMTVFYP